MSAKFTNCGQTCIAPDYLICHPRVLPDLIFHFKATIREFFGSNVLKSKDYSRIINENHWNRLNELLEKSQGEIVIGGSKSLKDKFMEPTIVSGVGWGDSLMQTEIFGPILPIIVTEDFDEAIQKVNAR